MKKIISFSLWGNNKNYLIGALKNVELSKTIYPGWICRFYVDKNLNSDIKNELRNLNSEVIEKTITHPFEPYLWRFLSTTDADIMISRDCDSRLSEREKVAVDEWLSSDKDFHIIRDHPHHNFLIMAGMWGYRGNLLNDIGNLINLWKHKDKKINDQIFLSDVIYPKVKTNVFSHDDFNRFNTNNHKIKHKRINYEYIGEYYDENDKCSEFHKQELKRRIG